MKRGDILDLDIVKLGFEGKGIAKINRSIIKPGDDENGSDNYVVFVSGTYPGDKVSAQLRKIKKSFAEATPLKILSSSKDRIEPVCKYFGVCGGCKQQDLNYESQVKYKQQLVKETFEHIGGLTDFHLESIIPAEKQYFYRNKMEYSFSDRRWLTKEELNKDEIPDKNFALGLHIPRIYDKVLDIHECHLQSEISNTIVNFTRKFFKKRAISIYSTKTHHGYLRYLVIRQSFNSDDIMVNIVTSRVNDELLEEYTNNLLNSVPSITTIVNNINTKKASIALGEYEKVFHGNGFIYDRIGDYKFRISANSFFQTNTLQAEKLYKTALDFADLNGNDTVYDLYSGAGTIAIYISGKSKSVYGFESVGSAVDDAVANTRINNIETVKFVPADLYKSFLPIIKGKNIPKADVILIDPPRSGMHKNTINDVIEISPQKIVYISCNPATQARDVKLMVESGYRLIKMRPVDMFPHTYHIENVALLAK